MPDILTIAQRSVILFDPHHCTDLGDSVGILEAVMEPLVRRAGPGVFEPALAESWSTGSDARTFRFNLRKGVHFHDGQGVDARAVLMSLERMTRPEIGSALGTAGVYAQYMADATLRAVDDHCIEIELPQPNADFLDILVYGYVISPNAVESAGDIRDLYVGTGPYVLESYEAGTCAEVVANRAYHGFPPSHGRIRWEAHVSDTDRIVAVQSGAAMATTGLPVRKPHERQATGGLGYAEYLMPTANIFMFQCAAGPLADRRVRRALNLALDRDRLIESSLQGGGQPLEGIVSPLHYGAPAAPRDMQADPEQARRLLSEAGVEGTLKLAVRIPDRMPDHAESVAREVARQFEAIGVALQIEVVRDRALYATEVSGKRIGDMCLFDSSPMSIFRVLHEKIDSRVKGAWWQGYRNPPVERLIDEARVTVDTDRRASVYEKCFRLLQDDPPWLYLYNVRKAALFRANSIEAGDFRDGVLRVGSARLP